VLFLLVVVVVGFFRVERAALAFKLACRFGAINREEPG
jgi:hypothetical protein